jgi:hypothetical protein
MKWVMTLKTTCVIICKQPNFFIQLDESTLTGNEALFLACFRFVMDQEIHKELLFTRTLTTDIIVEFIFNVLKDFSEKNRFL